MEDSTRSEIVKVVPSTNLTMAVSDLGPESSTERMDLAESLRIVSNSVEVTPGVSAEAMEGDEDVMAMKERVDAVVVRKVERRVRRCMMCCSSWIAA